MIKEDLKKIKGEFPEICQLNKVLAPLTSYQVGGPADIFVIPRTVEQLINIIRMCRQAKVDYFILGKGANILVHDRGVRGAVISLEKCCGQILNEGNLLYAGAGRTVKELVEYCEENSLSGLDFMSGIPGTVGGALTMNAGAFSGEIGDRVVRVEALDQNGARRQIPGDKAGFGYRTAGGLKDRIILGCWMMMDRGDRSKLIQSRQNILKRRADKQPLEHPSCGSVFKRPPGDYAGRFIEAAEQKGFIVGGAMVSTKHANFIVNFKQASAQDIYEVIWQVQQKVYKRFKTWLQLEVKLVGFSQEDQKRVQSPL